MRRSLVALVLPLLAGCGNKVDHPDAAPACDPATMDCRYMPPETSSGVIGGGDGGASGGDSVAVWSGQVLAFRDDDFEDGSVFDGRGRVSATGESGARVSAVYDGTAFELKDVLKAASNWFLMDPDDAQGVLPTLTVIDTRAVEADRLEVGVVRQIDVDGIYQLSLAGEPSPSRAQVVLRVVDAQKRPVPGVRAQLSAEVVAYRLQTTWDPSEGAATDESGMIFLGNVPATPTLSIANVSLSGSVNARVEIRIQAGATSIVTAIVSSP